jgi:hypothetical protein
MRGFEENRSPKRKNYGFDVTGADKLILAWHVIKEVAFLIFFNLRNLAIVNFEVRHRLPEHGVTGTFARFPARHPICSTAPASSQQDGLTDRFGTMFHGKSRF